eukprot:gnl/MRDRNA2_/MRDRNA2_104742_c0_seq1.p1 gnl/MRDRNA2_/MRDRNA2_104742_c0~~gnl/MRDRNA2_/MRDRNA2_104742_c0_seq1.p1  ORF type:complete len:315 (+),score=34.56 gnl/MRDRNA2_/MRDRNA2_104742_c0_seq1:90-1034(+)
MAATISRVPTGRLGRFAYTRDCSHRRYVTAQGGNEPRDGNPLKDVSDAPWGSTTNDRQFRSFSAAEMRDAVGSQVHNKELLGPATLNECGWRNSKKHMWRRHAEEFPTRSASTGAIRAHPPAAYRVAERPIRPRRFVASSQYRVNDLTTSVAMNRFSDKKGPNTYAPLPKYVVEHLVRTKGQQGGIAGRMGLGCGGPPSAETESEISYPTTFRSDSAPPSTAVTAETADTVGLSQAIRRMPKPIAQRRRDAFNRSPEQSIQDRDLFAEWREADQGSLGLQSYNLPPSKLGDSFAGYGDRLSLMAALLPGDKREK